MLIPTYGTRTQRGKALRVMERRKSRELSRQLRSILGDYRYYRWQCPLPCRFPKYPTDQELRDYW